MGENMNTSEFVMRFYTGCTQSYS